MSQNIMQLQNGSDVRGVALELEGGAPVTLTPEIAFRIAAAFAKWLRTKQGEKDAPLRLGVGHDSRLTAGLLKNAVIAGFASQGAEVMDCALASTPAMFMGTVFPQTAFSGAVMITASHLPKNRNGIKFFTRQGGTNKSDVTEILQIAEGLSEEISAQADGGNHYTAQPCNLMELYAASLREKIGQFAGAQNNANKPLAGLHIVVDAGNGAGGFFARQVLEPLGANCAGSQFLEPDGNFPNHAPNPEDKEAMAAISAAVVASKADLGIIFDTDVDRMSAVLPGGRAVNRNAIIAMMAAVIAPNNPGTTIVTDSVTSDHLTAFLEKKLGLRHHRFKRGYRNVINEAMRLNEIGTHAPLAIETSGHGALKENYFLDDGAYMAVRIVAAAAKAARQGTSLADLLDGLAQSEVELERRVGIRCADFAEYSKTVLQEFEHRAKDEGLTLAQSYEGVRVTFPGKGWLLLRMSLHDPVLPLNIEGNTIADADTILATAKKLLCGFDDLDVSTLA